MSKKRTAAAGEAATGGTPRERKSLRLWPGVVLAVLLLLVRFVVPMIMPDALLVAVLGGMAGGLLVAVWWLFFSRAPWLERLGALAVMIAALVATPYFLHKSVATGGMGMVFYLYALPTLGLAFVIWAVTTSRLKEGVRRITMVVAILLACGVWTLVRTGGISAELDSDFSWRWGKTPEEKLLDQALNEPVAIAPAPVVEQTPQEQLKPKPENQPAPTSEKKTRDESPVTMAGVEPVLLSEKKLAAEWPGFRGPKRDGIIHGVQIETDWSASPPKELWRGAVGPGWSSFAVHGDFFYTQEQRGEEEVVTCYRISTGELVWLHGDSARFWESNGGAGPRGTPTLNNGRVYTFGGTGILNVLDATSGAVVWSRNAARDTKSKTPYWGFSSSPLVVDDLVIVASSGALIAYDLTSGEPRWSRPDSSTSYSSPHLATIQGVTQVLTLSGTGLTGVVPADGALLWSHAWSGYPIVQPALTAEGDIFISVKDRSGLRRLALTHGTAGWNAAERWTSNGLKPYFNDFVIHKGHAFGFDGNILSCIELEAGARKWKGGRYGQGQFVLLADQDLLLVLSEKGELALVAAVPEQFTEFARLPAITGKTWNHPVMVNDVLLVRNAQEMAAFRLTLTAGRKEPASQPNSQRVGLR